MAFRSVLKLDSKIFNRAEVRRALSSVVIRTAKEFKQSTREKMQSAPHTGSVARQRSGDGFTRGRQRSVRGERPAVQSGNLANNGIVDRRTGELSAVVEIDESRAPYGAILVKELGRVIMSKEDAAAAEIEMQRRGNEVLRALL